MDYDAVIRDLNQVKLTIDATRASWHEAVELLIEALDQLAELDPIAAADLRKQFRLSFDKFNAEIFPVLN